VWYCLYRVENQRLSNELNFSRNRLTSEKKMKRLYLTSATLLLHLWEHPDMGRVVENLVVTRSGARFFWRKGTSEVDCVLVRGDEVVPLVSRYKNNIRKKDIKGLLKFMETFSAEKGLVVTKDREGEELVDGKWIVFVPLWK
jgi:predicted AAA+ superfamily ATPase